MNIRRIIFRFGIALMSLTALLMLQGCRVSFSLSGASIPLEAKTYSVSYFMNNATLIAPMLSPTLTDELADRLSRQTRLTQVREDGDISFEGDIVNYTSTPAAVSADEYTMRNRLTVTIRVTYKNKIQPEAGFENRSFSAYLEYDTSIMLQDAERTLIPQLVEALVDDIFNTALSNW